MPPSTNILLITSDQQHWSTLGSLNPRICTPALDRICAEGTQFNRAYCPNPTCSPTRASLITGQYPSRHGCWAIGVKLPEDVPTVGEEFTRMGYTTSLIGKAHFQPLASTPDSSSIECQPLLRDLDYWRAFKGNWYGFQQVETARMHGHESHAGQHYALWMEKQGLPNWQEYFQRWPPDPNDKYSSHYLRGGNSWDLPEEFHHSHWVGQRTCAHIQQNAADSRPFFIWSSFFDPHPPYVVPEPWASMYKPEDMEIGHLVPGELEKMPRHHHLAQQPTPDFSAWDEPGGQNVHGFHSHLHDEETLKRSMALYYGMVSLMDANIGLILDALDESGLAENTLVVFTSDHGHFLGHHGLIAKGPFHYEDLIRVPMVVRQPGVVPAGRTSESLQSLVDYPQTFLAVAGGEPPSVMQGINQWPVWQDKESSARDWALVENRHNPTTVHLRTFVTERYKLTLYRGTSEGELFDLDLDPGETRNLFHDPESAGLRADLMHRFLQAEMERETSSMARVSGA